MISQLFLAQDREQIPSYQTRFRVKLTLDEQDIGVTSTVLKIVP